MPKIRDPIHVLSMGNRIRARRLWLGFTLEDIAPKVDVAWQQIHKYETGKSDPPTSTLIRIAAALQTTAGALLGEDGHRKADPHANEAAALLADPSVSAILHRLRTFDRPKRQLAHSLICTLRADI